MSYIRQFTNSSNNAGDITSCMYARAYRPKRIIGWDDAALAGAGVATSLATSLFGGSASARAQQEAERQAKINKSNENAWYKKQEDTSIEGNAVASNAWRNYKDYAQSAERTAAGRAAVTGDVASEQKTKDSLNSGAAQTLGNLTASLDSNNKSLGQSKMQSDRAYTNTMMNINNAKAANTANAASAASNAIMTGASLLAGSSTKNSASAVKPEDKTDTF